MTLPRLLLLLRVVLLASGRANRLQRHARRAARRSSSSSSSSSSLVANNSANSRRPLSPTAAPTPRKSRALLATSLGSHFLTLLLLLLVVNNANEIRHQRHSLTRQTESTSQQIQTSPSVPILQARPSSRTPFLIFRTLSTEIPETWTNLWSLLHLPTRVRAVATIKGAHRGTKEHFHSPNLRKDTFLTAVASLMSISFAKSSVS